MRFANAVAAQGQRRGLADADAFLRADETLHLLLDLVEVLGVPHDRIDRERVVAPVHESDRVNMVRLRAPSRPR
jgi:hypothetical protein